MIKCSHLDLEIKVDGLETKIKNMERNHGIQCNALLERIERLELMQLDISNDDGGEADNEYDSIS